MIYIFFGGPATKKLKQGVSNEVVILYHLFYSFSGAENESRDIHPIPSFPDIGRLNTETVDFDYVFFLHDSG